MELIWADGKYNNRSLDRWLAKAKVGYRGDRQTAGVGGLREVTETVGRGEDVRLDRSVSEKQPGLGVVHEYQRADDPNQLDSSNAQKIEAR